MTDHIGLTEGDRVVFTGYTPSKPEIYGVITLVLRRPPDHPAAGEITGYVLEVTGGHGVTLCAEPDQLRADDLLTVHFDGGPWHGRTALVRTVTAPVFAVGDAEGKHYWLDQNSDPPTYRWITEDTHT